MSGIFFSAGVDSLKSIWRFMAEKWEIPRVGIQGIPECVQLPFGDILAAE